MTEIVRKVVVEAKYEGDDQFMVPFGPFDTEQLKVESLYWNVANNSVHVAGVGIGYDGKLGAHWSAVDIRLSKLPLKIRSALISSLKEGDL